MKVIASAENNPNLWTAQVSCTGQGIRNAMNSCGSLLEINMTDVVRSKYVDLGGVTEVYYYFTCPICGCKTELTGKLRREYLKSIQ